MAYKLTLTDADGVVLESWVLGKPGEVGDDLAWLDQAGRLDRISQGLLGLEVAEEIDRQLPEED